MICQRCKKREATIVFRTTTGDDIGDLEAAQKTEEHYCEQCILSPTEPEESENKTYAAEEDKRAQKILKSPDIMEAKDWLGLYPRGLFSSHAIDENDFNGTPLVPVVDRLTKAGAIRLVVHHAHRKIFLGLIVVLPDNAKARKKIFAIEQELSQVCLQREAEDCGQKYLYYSLQ